MTMLVTLSFSDGLSLLPPATEEFTSKLTRIGGITAFVRVTARQHG